MVQKLQRIEIEIPSYNREKGENDNPLLMRVVEAYDRAFNDLENFMKNYDTLTGVMFSGSGKLDRLGNSEQVEKVEDMCSQLNPIWSIYHEVAMERAKEKVRNMSFSELEKLELNDCDDVYYIWKRRLEEGK